MNLNIVVLTSDTSLSFAHILKLEALGDIFFSSRLKIFDQDWATFDQKFYTHDKVDGPP